VRDRGPELPRFSFNDFGAHAQFGKLLKWRTQGANGVASYSYEDYQNNPGLQSLPPLTRSGERKPPGGASSSATPAEGTGPEDMRRTGSGSPGYAAGQPAIAIRERQMRARGWGLRARCARAVASACELARKSSANRYDDGRRA